MLKNLPFFVPFSFVGLLLVGCYASDGPKCYPVTGTVLVNDQPAADALVVFHPRLAFDDKTPQPMAYTDAQGAYSLTTLNPGDGAPPGEYAITVELRAERQIGEEIVRDGPSILPARYGSAKESGLAHTVVVGVNQVPALRLKNP